MGVVIEYGLNDGPECMPTWMQGLLRGEPQIADRYLEVWASWWPEPCPVSRESCSLDPWSDALLESCL